MPCGERRVELADAVPLLGDEAEVHRPVHALARAVYYGQRGRISAREVYDQMNACSCLTLILACIVYWQAREISRLVAAPDFPFEPDLLRHVSPIEWKNVVLYGEIKIDPAGTLS